MKLFSVLLLITLLTNLGATAQMRNIYTDTDANNPVKNFSFYQPNEGFVAFGKWVGYTVDSGRTFSRRYVTLNNVDYNGYSVSLTGGFSINGVQAFSKDSLLLYGDYGFRMAILFSKDGGATFRLVHHPNNPPCTKMLFTSATTGYCISPSNVWKTTDRGISWSNLGSPSVAQIMDIKAYGANTLFLLYSNYVFKSIDGGLNWTAAQVPGGGTSRGLEVVTADKLWLSTSANFGSLYYSTNAGATWTRKNNPALYEVNTPNLVFINDTTGYFTDDTFDIYKTTDAGVIWEKLPRNTNYTYLGFTHTSLFFYNNQQFWAGGGGYGFIELTTNGGGITKPNAQFLADTSRLRSTGNIVLNNFSKQGPAYSYRWYRGTTLFATTYNASYVSARNYIDTIRLVVDKNGLSDTAIRILDTRTNIQPCVADFTLAKSDTGRVVFTSAYQDAGRTHLWDFGDGTRDSSSVNPVHFYSATGTYAVKHYIYNTISHCSDSATNTVTITRITACLKISFTATPDSFFANKITFTARYDTTLESGTSPITSPINWSFGNGTSATNTTQQLVSYAAGGTYNVCLSLKNRYTGCISQMCRPVTMVLDTCNADFGMKLGLANNRFEGKVLQTSIGKAHYWIIDNQDTIRTGRSNVLDKDFFKRGADGDFFNFYSSPSSICSNVTREINLDSLNKTIRHVVVDSLSGCISSVEKSLVVPIRIENLKIRAIPDPEIPDVVTFSATQTFTNSSWINLYASIWRKHYTSFSGGYVGYSYDKILMTYTSPGTYNYAVAADKCPEDGIREVYTINYQKGPLDPCGVKQPQMGYRQATDNPYLFYFQDTAFNRNDGMQVKQTIYYGNGDSAVMRGYFFNYTYPQPGFYTYTVKAISQRTGCTKTVSGTIAVRCPRPSYTIQKDAQVANRIRFINATTQDTGTVAYRWQFGNGDTSAEREPVYTYPQPGVYKVSLQANFVNGCNFQYDSLITVPAAACNTGNVFGDTTITLLCSSDSVNLLSLYNTPGYRLYWNTASPQKAGLGSYRLLAANDNHCADTAYVKVVQDVAVFVGNYNGDWHNVLNWQSGKLPTARSHVIVTSIYNQCVLSAADVAIASLQVLPGRMFSIKNNRSITFTTNCSSLPPLPPE